MVTLNLCLKRPGTEQKSRIQSDRPGLRKHPKTVKNWTNFLMFEIRYCPDCSVNAHANISALFLTVCARAHGCKINYQIRKWICVVLRFRSQLRVSIRGSSVRTVYSCLVSRLPTDPFSQSVQLPNRCLQTFLKFVSKQTNKPIPRRFIAKA